VRENHAETLLAERSAMLFSGTSVTRGAAEGVVVAIGMQTELGQISRLVAEVKDEATPLERRLEELGRKLSWLTLAVALAVALVGVVSGRPPLLILETSIALAVATVPEGLPIVATLALARGMARMARRNALCARLAVVETLGATSVILTDKTGTLTQNRLAVEELVIDHQRIVVECLGGESTAQFFHDGRALRGQLQELLGRALRAGVLCNDAHVTPAGEGVGEPLEVALLMAGGKAGLDAEALKERLPEIREEAFDPETRMMATFHEQEDAGLLVQVKGAPEAVIAACRRAVTRRATVVLDEKRRGQWLDHNRQLASRGLRVLALAEGVVADRDDAPYRDLTLLGLVAMADPPRSEVRQVIDDCRAAGVRVVMVTGDQAQTALRVAESVGLVESGTEACVLGVDHELSRQEQQEVAQASVIARTSPRQKLEVLATHQRRGAVVAMLGDGVNDAPALRRANIGVAMGRGTQVAKEASDLVLNDDRLSTVVVAIGEGRVIFENIRKFALYLLSCNASELGAVGVAALIGLPLPVLPLQILFLNLVTDVFPALALGACEGQSRALKLAPRPSDEGVLERRHWLAIGGHGAVIAATVLGALLVATYVLELPAESAVSVSFATLGFAQLTHVFNMRGEDSPAISNEVTRNLWVWGAVLLCSVLLLLALYAPPLAAVLGTRALDARGWSVVGAASATPLLFGGLLRLLVRRRTGAA
ncbi:MAG: cation-transporting P-type ATPase, partial [Myxococcales bacterium]|nr:cation-transporting P-type ATPase [Myxococcales bacterium]